MSTGQAEDDVLGESENLTDILPLAQTLTQDDEIVKMLMNASGDLVKTEGKDI